MQKQDRLGWVDMAKGLSIILVVMMHTAYGVGEDTGQTGILHWVIGFATPFRMPEFFLISGLFLSNVIMRDWRRYADRRVVHYFYFYALWAFILIALKVGIMGDGPVAAAQELVLAAVQPYSVLWFVYLLAIFSAVAKLAYELKAPHWLMLGLGALLQVAPVNTGSYVVNEFAAYFVYFYMGYVFAPLVFKLVDGTSRVPVDALIGLAIWALVNGMLVFLPNSSITPLGVEMGLAGLPVVHLILAIAGSMALCIAAGLLNKLSFMGWLRWLGANSIVIYLSFSIPMAISRVVLLKTGIITDASLLSLIVLAIAIATPALGYLFIQRTGIGRFLFERPAWAHQPNTATPKRPAVAPAE